MAKKQVDLASAGFKINGKVPGFSSVPFVVIQTIEILEKLPFKELVTTRQLAGLVGIQFSSFAHYAPHPFLSMHRFNSGTASKGYYWGSKKTLAELKKHLVGE